MIIRKISIPVFLLAASLHAEFLVQGSFSMQVVDKITRMAGYPVEYTVSAGSPYDLSVGYSLSFKDIAVMPVMLEGKSTTIESYLNLDKIAKEDIAPLEVLLKPGLRLTNTDIYMILGYQLGSFTQKVEQQGHEFALKMKPNFYGAGYAKGLSDYLDYLAEVKVYYHSKHSYGFDLTQMEVASDLTISDARVRFGLRVRI